MLISIINAIKMLYDDRIDISERIIANKRSESKECDICHVTIGIS